MRGIGLNVLVLPAIAIPFLGLASDLHVSGTWTATPDTVVRKQSYTSALR